MLGRKPWVRWPPASSDMPSSRWLPSSWRSVSQSASLSSLTFLAPSLSSAGRLDAVGQDRPERDQVGVDAGVRLHVGVRRAEQLAGVLGGERLDGVDVLAAGVEAVADRALGVLVAEPGAHRQQHGRRGVVLAGDQLERGALVGQLLAGGLGDPRLDRGDHLQGRVVGAWRRSWRERRRRCQQREWLRPCGVEPQAAATARLRVSASWTAVSLHGIPVCGTGVQPPETCPMISRCNLDHVPRGPPPRGPRAYAQHDLLASLNRRPPAPPRPPSRAAPATDQHRRTRLPCLTCATPPQPAPPDRDPAPQARRGPVGARLHRAAEQERAVQEGRRPAQRARPGSCTSTPSAASPRSTRPTCAAGSAGWASTPSAPRASTAARPRCSRRRSSTTSSSCCASAPTARCSRRDAVRALGTIGVDFARDTADVTDRENIQYHWIRIEDVPEIWQRLDDAGLSTPRGVRRLAAPVPRLPRRRRRRRRDHRRHQRAGGDPAPLHRQPGVLEPAAQVQDRADRAPQPRRLPRDQRRLVRRHRPPRARPRLRPVGRRRPVHQPDARPEGRASGSRSTRSPTSGRAWPRSSATTATAGCARAPG